MWRVWLGRGFHDAGPDVALRLDIETDSLASALSMPLIHLCFL